MRFNYLPCLLLLLALPAGASPYDWRSYPNEGHALQYDLSPEWLLLDRGSVAPEALESVLGKVAPTAVLARLLPLVADRVAVRVVGLDVEGLRQYGEALRMAGAVANFWPVASRERGLGFLDDHLIVAGTPDAAQLEKRGVRLLGPSGAPGLFSAVAIDGDGIGAAWRLADVPGVRFAEPDLIRDAISLALPDDPRLGDQWHLENTEGETGSIHTSEAWDMTTGDPATVVGIIDTGFDLDHPDLEANIVGGFDALTDDGVPEADCSDSPDGAGAAGTCPANRPYRESHGTAVAGIVAARANNGLLGSGVCPDCTLFPIRFIGSGGFRSLSSAATFSRAAEAGVSVINNSWGPNLTRFFPLAQAERETFDRVSTQGRDGRGIVLVFAAGNDFFTPATANPYTSHPGVVTVSASTRTDDFACYSNYGTVIAVAGPSQGCFDGESGIGTTDYVGAEGYSNNDFTRGFGGTSAASPVVAGLAALILSANPNLTAQQVRLVMERTAEKIRADKNPWQQQLGVDLATEFDYDEHGFSVGFGYGRINAARAVAMAVAMPDNVAGLCDDQCPRCINDRCAPDCATDADCPAASRCQQVEGGLACVIPQPGPTEIGQPCLPDCETCVTTVDSNFDEARVCSAACETDDECPFGFDCRTLRQNTPRACVPGNQECGSPWGSVRCQGDVRVVGGGLEFCSCECIPGTQGACPDGFQCVEQVFCNQDRGGLLCERRDGGGATNYYPSCFPDPSFRQPCAAHRDCPGGLFCVDGSCRADTNRAGCDICAPCQEDDDCAREEFCVATPRGQRCLKPCEFGVEGTCPGDSVCADVPGPAGDHCINPDASRKGVCPSAYRCLVEDRCYLAEDCPNGVPCVDHACQTPEVPDQGVPDAAQPDAAVVDAVVTDSVVFGDAAATTPDQGDETDTPKPSDDGCSSTPGAPGSPLWLFLGLVFVVRRRGGRAFSGR